MREQYQAYLADQQAAAVKQEKAKRALARLRALAEF